MATTVTQICGATKSYDNKRNQKLGMDQISRGPIYGILNPIFRNLQPTVRALLESYTIDMVMPIPGIISFLLIGKSKQRN